MLIAFQASMMVDCADCDEVCCVFLLSAALSPPLSSSVAASSSGNFIFSFFPFLDFERVATESKAAVVASEFSGRAVVAGFVNVTSTNCHEDF